MGYGNSVVQKTDKERDRNVWVIIIIFVLWMTLIFALCYSCDYQDVRYKEAKVFPSNEIKVAIYTQFQEEVKSYEERA